MGKVKEYYKQIWAHERGMAEAELRHDAARKELQGAGKQLSDLLKVIAKSKEEGFNKFEKRLEDLQMAVDVEIPKLLKAAEDDYFKNKAQQRAKGQQLRKYIATKLEQKKDIKSEKRNYYKKLMEEMRLNFS